MSTHEAADFRRWQSIESARRSRIAPLSDEQLRARGIRSRLPLRATRPMFGSEFHPVPGSQLSALNSQLPAK